MNIRYSNKFYYQVGMRYSSFTRACQLKEKRPCKKLDSTNPIPEETGEAAAALAASYIVFKEKDPDCSKIHLKHAKHTYKYGGSCSYNKRCLHGGKTTMLYLNLSGH